MAKWDHDDLRNKAENFQDNAYFDAPPPQQYNAQNNAPTVRTFATGATRDTDENKLDFEGFLSPLVLKAFAEYMHEKRKMPDGSLRASDNWQLGIPVAQYMKSMFRHFFAVWEHHRAGGVAKEDLLALFFNVQGMLHEVLKRPEWPAPGSI